MTSRRHQVWQWSEAERAIVDAMNIVEDMGADRRLTEAVVLLGKAQEFVADYIDDVPFEEPPIVVHTPKSEGIVFQSLADLQAVGEFFATEDEIVWEKEADLDKIEEKVQYFLPYYTNKYLVDGERLSQSTDEDDQRAYVELVEELVAIFRAQAILRLRDTINAEV